nr:hypothetical protein [uncultured Lichenicoccus sp.]
MSALSWLATGLAVWGGTGLAVAFGLGLLIRRANRKAVMLRRRTLLVGNVGAPAVSATEVQKLEPQGLAGRP